MSTSDCEGVEIGLSDLLGGFEGAAAAEDGEPREEPLLVLVEELVAPLDRGAQRPLARIGVARPPFSRSSRCVEALDQLLRREDSHARRRELEGERQAVEPARRSRRRSSGLKSGATALARAMKSSTASSGGEGRDRVLTAPPQSAAAPGS